MPQTTIAVLTGDGVDEKYHKRRKQKETQRLRQSLLLFIVAILFLIYTRASLWSVSESNGSDAYRTQQRGGSQDRRRRGGAAGQRAKPNEAKGFLESWFRDDTIEVYEKQLEELDEIVVENKNMGIRWVRPELLPTLDSYMGKPLLNFNARERNRWKRNTERFFHVKRLAKRTNMAWETHSKTIDTERGPLLDFTKHAYEYPEKQYELPPLGKYPPLAPMRELMDAWPQDDIDHPPSPYREQLIHFDYTDPRDLEAARLFRDAKLPFKLTNVPEVAAAGLKWTDEYVTLNFDGGPTRTPYPRAEGTCQESSDNFFAFFAVGDWPVHKLGVPPTRNNDYTYAKWAEHARYADASSLHPHQPHFYWQAGVDRGERHMPMSQWTFISRDLPSFSSPTETFFVFEPESQKGIQCRFGERGVTAATHFDSGRNMVAMITGAKRYILSPPKACTKLGIVTKRENPIFRHSMLNFGHLNEIDNPEMPQDEREWLKRSSEALAVETVLKAGEVLYIPSHWFHYITSLQKSAQCNVRSGIDLEGDPHFGGKADVTDRCEAEFY